jgi:cell division protein FtsQ
MSLFTRHATATGNEDQAVDAADAERTVQIARKKFVRRQWARRWLAWRRVVVAVLVVALVVGGAWLVFFSSVLAVKQVQVEGARSLDPQAVQRAAHAPYGQPLATVDLAAVTARVENLAAVKSVDVSRSWPDGLRIAIVERQAVAVVQRGSTLRGLDEDGVIFRRYPSRPHGLPVVRTGPHPRTDALAEAARVAGSLPADVARRVDYVEVRTVDAISLRLRNGKTVLWGSADGSAAKARVLPVLLERHASFYDVSVPGDPLIR